MKESSEVFRDWTPVRVVWRDSQPFVEWVHMAGQRFEDPFFQDTVQRMMRLPFNTLFRRQTPIEQLDEVINSVEIVPPTGFIFHMSRCGSTLVSQMLAKLTSNIVISEAPPIDSVIAMRHNSEWDGDVEKVLTATVAALGRRRSTGERRYFIKFDSWNILDLDLILSAFPSVPFVFLYRNPLEVIVSQMNQRGSQMVPGAMTNLMPDLGLEVALSMSGEEYCARVLAKHLESALKFVKDERMLLINYDQLPEAVWTSIATHFGVTFTDDEIVQMKEASQFNAKTPQFSFESDSERKRASASDEASRATKQFLDPLYKELEKHRSRSHV